MSYDIIYQKKFLKVGDKIAPLTLMGCSNVTEFKNGREVLEREWWPLMMKNWSDSHFCCKVEEILYGIRKNVADNVNPYEWFKYGSKWIVNDNLESFYVSGIRNAKTLEEYRAECRHSNWADPSIVLSVRDSISGESMHEHAQTNKELIQAVEKADAFCKRLESGPSKCNLYIRFGFQYNEKLENRQKNKRAKSERPEEFYALQNQAGYYLTRLAKYGYRYSPYIERAKWFRTKKEAENWLEKNRYRIDFDNTVWTVSAIGKK